MYNHNEENKKKVSKKQIIKIWSIGIIVTIVLIYLQAIFLKWIASLFNYNLPLGEVILYAILSNLLMGFYQGIKTIWQKKK